MDERRRVHSAWRVRTRYHRGARLAGGLGAALAATLVTLMWVGATRAGRTPGIGFYLFGALLVLAGAYLPWRMVIARWRRVRSLHDY